jgi:protein-S-isoprenylcysteine O-methyltransferase Ste14
VSRLPSLGPRGEGWFAGQMALFGFIGAAGVAVGDAWTGSARTASEIVGGVLLLAGGILAFRGLVDLRENLTPLPAPVAHGRLVDTGSYALVRHPIYSGLIAGASGWGLALASPLALVGAAVLALFFDLKSRREEIWLAEKYPDYAGYRSRTRKLVPRIY